MPKYSTFEHLCVGQDCFVCPEFIARWQHCEIDNRVPVSKRVRSNTVSMFCCNGEEEMQFVTKVNASCVAFSLRALDFAKLFNGDQFPN